MIHVLPQRITVSERGTGQKGSPPHRSYQRYGTEMEIIYHEENDDLAAGIYLFLINAIYRSQFLPISHQI